MPDVDLEVKRDFWSRLRGSQKVHTTILNAEQVSPKTQGLMHALEESGGSGRYEQIEVLDWTGENVYEAIRVFSPPLNPIYGSAFENIFQELQAHNIPVFITAYVGAFPVYFFVAGQILVDQLGPGTEAFVFLRAKAGNLIARHELQHIHDYVTHYDEFLSALPEPSEKLIQLLERREAGEALNRREEKLLEAANGVRGRLLETRAYEASLAAIFSKQGLREIADPKTWPWEILNYYNALFSAGHYNGSLFFMLQSSDLSDSYSGESAIAFKGVFYSFTAFFIGIYILESLYKVVRQVVAPASKAAFKAARKGLDRCSLAARSLLRG